MKTACLLSKPSRRKVEVQVDYIGFTIEDHFVVGYGLDYAEKYRNLPYIAILETTDAVWYSASTSSPRADARQIERGATVELSKGGHVTPLAQDTLRERRVTVVPAGSVDPALPADLAPRSDIRRVAIASDHTGVALRTAIVQHLRGSGHRGRRPRRGRHGAGGLSGHRRRAWPGRWRAARPTPASSSTAPGIGSAIAANKVRGIRAAMMHRRDDRPVLARAQRRQRDDARARRCCPTPRPRSASSTSGSARR